MRKLFIILVIMVFISCGGKNMEDNNSEENIIKSKASLEYVNSELKKLASVNLEANLENIAESKRNVLKKLKEASKIIDNLFLKQVYSKNIKIREELEKISEKNERAYLKLFNIMFGPWNRIDSNRPFINKQEKPEGANFYPIDMSKEEFMDFLKANPDKKEKFESNFTIIRRINAELTAIPYHEIFKDDLKKIKALLEEASELAEEPSLKKYLKLRAEALLTDEYFKSDMAWMDLEGNIEIVIGPYEVYEDRLFGYKAAYESFVCIVDKEKSEELEKITKYLIELEKNLPIPDEHKNLERGSSSPIKVVNQIFSAGDTKAGVQTTAFNLPNDERVRKAKGSKKVMLKNVARAKYKKCWIPIVNRILAGEPLENVSFNAYFTHVLMHEISHGLGPGFIEKNGVETTVGKELKDIYSTIEECKADILGVYNIKYLIDKGFYPEDFEKSLYSSYLGGMLRSIRFGIEEAHGAGVAIQFNYLLERGAFFINKNGKLDLDYDKIYPAVRTLANEILLIQATGNYSRGKKLIKKYSKLTPELKIFISQLKDVPIDIKPIYPEL